MKKVMFISSCGGDKIKVKTIAPDVETYQTYEITNYMGHLVSMELTDKEIKFMGDVISTHMGEWNTSPYSKVVLTTVPIVRKGNPKPIVIAILG